MNHKSLQRYVSLLRSWRGDRPASGYSVTLEVAFRCNVRCVFCSRWDDPTDLDLETICGIAEDMSATRAAYVSLTGGDPFVRSDIKEIIDAFATRSVPIHINTNGVLLRKYADFLKSRAAAFVGITVSIDSPEAAVHDEIRGVAGTFRRALLGMDLLRDHIPLSLACTLNQKNLHEIESYTAFARDLGYDFRFQPLHDDGANQLSPNQEGVAVHSDGLEGLTERLESTHLPGDSFAKRQYYRLFETFFRNRDSMSDLRCTTAARLIYFISPEGDVYPCDTRRDIKLGNVYASRFAEIIGASKSTSWRETCRKQENGCWCMYACVAPNNVRYEQLPMLPLTRGGWPVSARWSERFGPPVSLGSTSDAEPSIASADSIADDALPPVGIVVASYNGGEFLRQSVEALLAMDYPADRRQLVLVDDAGSDESIENVKRAFRDAVASGELEIVRSERNLGVPGAYNLGVRESNSDARYILKADNDVLPRPDALRRMVELAEANPRAGIVGGRIYFHRHRERIQFIGGRISSALRGPARIDTPSEVARDPVNCGPRRMEVINSCFSLVRRDVFEMAGLYPEFYGRYEYEDYDFAFHARRFGFFSVYCPDAVAYHAVSLTSSSNELSALRVRQRARNGLLFMSRFASRGRYVSCSTTWRRYRSTGCGTATRQALCGPATWRDFASLGVAKRSTIGYLPRAASVLPPTSLSFSNRHRKSTSR